MAAKKRKKTRHKASGGLGSDARVTAKILAIRKAAGNPGTQCPTCGQPAHAPYRRRGPGGEITEGCIDAFHGPSLKLGGASPSREWHEHERAKGHRRRELGHLLDILRP